MTEAENLIKEICDSYQIFYAIERSTDDYLYVADLKTNTFVITENMVKDFALPGRITKNLSEIWGNRIHKEDRNAFFNSMEALVLGKSKTHDLEYRMMTANGEWCWVHCRGLLQSPKESENLIFIGVITALRNKGKVDYITGLFTRAECTRTLDYLFEKESDRGNGSLILLGLDNFTRINVLNNHTFGDSVLRNFAQDIQMLLPPEASIYHFDGDEFAIIVENCELEELDKIYARIYTYVNRHHMVDGLQYFCTASAGAARMMEDADNSFDLIKNAAYAMEYSKNNGKNQLTHFSNDLRHNKVKTLKLINLLQESALNHFKGFYLTYQPQVDVDTMNVIGAEALVRFTEPELGTIFPGEFIPLLETTGLILPVGRYIFEEAVKTCKEWIVYKPDFTMSINLSYLQLLDVNLNEFVVHILNKYQVNARHIVVELTESCIVQDMEHLKSEFSFLRSLGIEVAMDDFGTGYSSLGMLAQSPADIIKIDRIFTSKIDQNTFNHTFINMVVKLCHSVGLEVCIEGVEREEELNVMKEMGADTIQGYLISKPIEKELFYEKFIAKGVEGIVKYRNRT